MKELEIIIKPEKLENLKRILDSEGAGGVMISTIFGYTMRPPLLQVPLTLTPIFPRLRKTQHLVLQVWTVQKK